MSATFYVHCQSLNLTVRFQGLVIVIALPSIAAGIEVLAIAHRPLPAGTVRNERDRHGPLQPLGGVRQEGGLRRISVSRRGGQNSFLR